ncbi:MAG: hypothetical protein A3205_01955 [Methanomassiliicoccales archaeon Mx-03]|nr:heavy metal-binding domain-containing protein [Methanomassiliicoccaceae archaeon DOK]TQS79569.1 MAG: hypothetical protein A3205_01955 [Methanomassiliicoccales archaeon Mx-03]
MLLTTTDLIPGRNYEIIGLVKGSMIQSKNIGRDIGQSLKSVVGGELKDYTLMMNESRAVATKRMVEEAESQGADAIVAIRYGTSAIAAAAAEVFAYGTAVKFI